MARKKQFRNSANRLKSTAALRRELEQEANPSGDRRVVEPKSLTLSSDWVRGKRSPAQAGEFTTAKQNSKKSEPDREHDNERVIAQNRKARHEYEILETLECGIVLVGSEVKSLRAGHLSLDEAYARFKDGELWLVGCDIQEYVYSHRLNHVPRRPRKLLLHRRELKKFVGPAYEKNLTLVPLKMYFKEGRAKVLIALCRGKKLYDKRETKKKQVMQRDIDRAMRGRGG